MSVTLKSLKGQIIQWDSLTGHIAIQIGSNYVSFAPNKTKPEERVHDKKGKPVTRFDVPGIDVKEGLPLYKREGLLKSFEDDLDVYKDTYRLATFDLPSSVLSKNPIRRPMRSSYQLFDANKGDRSHNNCVDYVRAEIFALLGDEYMDLKYTLLDIHTPLEFFNALQKYKVLEKSGAVNVIFYPKCQPGTHKNTRLS